MLGSEIRAYADLNHRENDLINEAVKTCASDWETGKSQFITGATAMLGYLKANGYNFSDKWLESKEMLITWFNDSAKHLDSAFPTHYTEKIGNDARGIEIDAVNDEIAKFKRCAEYIENYM